MRDQPDPTQPLSNPRHEAFVQALLRGEPATKAYASAGYKLHHANAARMRENEGIRARLAELQRITTDRVIDETGVTVSGVTNELAKLGFSNMQNYFRVAPDGAVCLDLSGCTNDHWAAVHELIIEDKPGSGDDPRVLKRVKIKLHNKEAALVSVGKHLGMFDKSKGNIPLNAAPVPQRPSPERIEEMRKRFAPKTPQLRSIGGGKQE